MYGNKLAVAIKSSSKILREFKDTVYIPFGSEYSIFIKNLNSVRAVVHITIDGTDVAPGGVVVNANSSIDLERFIKNGNLLEGNRFKFIERTASIEQHRGIGIDDGLIRIEYQFEKPASNYVFNPLDKYSSYGGTSGTGGNMMNIGGVFRGIDYRKGENSRLYASSATAATLKTMGIATNSSVHDGMATMDSNDLGITVPGSYSSQQFTTVTVGLLEAERHVMILRLLGETADNKPVTKPITVKHKPRCETCGRQNRAHAKFCVECGTALKIFA